MSNDTDVKKSGGWFKKLLLIVVGGFVLLMVIGALAGGDESGGGSDASDTEAAAVSAPPVEVTARELEAAYAANEVAAQQQYGDRRLLVNARIQSIQLDFADDPYLVLDGSNQFMGPQAHLADASKSMAGSLSKHQNVTLLCESVTELAGTPMLKDCVVQ